MIIPTLVVAALGFIAYNMYKEKYPPRAYISPIYDAFTPNFDQSDWFQPENNIQNKKLSTLPNEIEFVYNAGIEEWHNDEKNLPIIAQGSAGAGFYPSDYWKDNISIINEPQ